MELNKPGDAGPAYVGKPHEDRQVEGVPRDHYGRYALPQLDGTPAPTYQNGNPIGMVRASTLKSELINKDGVRMWREALVAEGLATSPDLITRAAEAAKIVDVKAKRAKLREISEEAFTRAGGKERSTLGTAVHAYHEARTKGEPVPEAPAEHQPSITALDELMTDNKITVIPELSERVLKLPFGAAGTVDNVVRWLNPDTEDFELVVADLKTGRSLEHAWLEMLLQLWQYANAEAMAVIREGQPISYEPMPMDVRRDRALIMHVPMNGTAQLYVADLSGVYEYIQAAVTSRRANAEAQYKFRPVGPLIDKREGAFVAPVTRIINAPAPGIFVPPETTAVDAGHRQAMITSVGGAVTPIPTALSDAADTEVGPTGRKRKACSVCRQPGHTAKNCPQNPDSPKFDAAAHRAAVNADQQLPPSEPESRGADPEKNGDWTTTAPQYCPTAGAGGWTAVDGHWVCGCHGLPARAAVEAQLSRVSPKPETVAPLQQDDSVVTDIKRAESIKALNGVWSLATAKGLWDPAKHDPLAASRAQDLMMEGKME